MKIKILLILSIVLTIFQLGYGFFDRKLDESNSKCHFKVNILQYKWILKLNNDHICNFIVLLLS
jgi:hypothetical protein